MTEPLWTDERIDNVFWLNGNDELAHDAAKMRNQYEAERKQLLARIAELEAGCEYEDPPSVSHVVVGPSIKARVAETVMRPEFHVDYSEYEAATNPTDTEINPAAGCTVYNYSAVYLDDNVTPEEAATMILATLGPVYVDKLIDALMDTFKEQPRNTESVKENL